MALNAGEFRFTEKYRKADSTWTLATPEELEAGLAFLRDMIDDGQADKWLEDREVQRKKSGQTTAIMSVKK